MVVPWLSGLYVWRGGPDYPDIQIPVGKLRCIDNIQKNLYPKLKSNSLKPKYCT